MSSSILEWLAKQSNCALKTVGQLFGLQEFGYVFPKGSEMREAFSEAITENRAASHEELSPKYLRSSTACDRDGSVLSSAQVLKK